MKKNDEKIKKEQQKEKLSMQQQTKSRQGETYADGQGMSGGCVWVLV